MTEHDTNPGNEPLSTPFAYELGGGSCRSYRPGHQAHYLAMTTAFKRGEYASFELDGFRVEDDGWTTLELAGGDQWRVWNHDPDRVRRALGAYLLMDADRSVLHRTQPPLVIVLPIGSHAKVPICFADHDDSATCPS